MCLEWADPEPQSVTVEVVAEVSFIQQIISAAEVTEVKQQTNLIRSEQSQKHNTETPTNEHRDMVMIAQTGKPAELGQVVVAFIILVTKISGCML